MVTPLRGLHSRVWMFLLTVLSKAAHTHTHTHTNTYATHNTKDPNIILLIIGTTLSLARVEYLGFVINI